MSARFAVIVARFNAGITDGLLAGAREAFAESGVTADELSIVRVPGAFEIPVTALRLAESGQFSAIVCLGCLIKGDTMHFEYIADATMRGIMDVALASALPVSCGVLTTTTEEQAVKRSVPGPENKGRDAALAAVEMVALFAQRPFSPGEDAAT
jgi:6,7-dimethyl-8-ribityllumazine synthase